MARRPQAIPLQNSPVAALDADPLPVEYVPPRALGVRIWKARPLFAGTTKLHEHVISHLFPLVEIPRYVYAAESRFQNENDIAEACTGPGPIPYLLEGSSLFTLAPPGQNSGLSAALKQGGRRSRELFADWLSRDDRLAQATELLNRYLQYHAWKRGMRFDPGHSLFYFTRSKPKKLWWEYCGKLMQREVTAPHMKWNQFDNGERAEFQCGWKHEAIRAAFLHTGSGLFLRLEPAWLLTQLDGRTPSTDQAVGPADPCVSPEQQTERTIQALCFWSSILAKGHRELRIETGAEPIRVRLTPAGDSAEHSFKSDGINPVATGLPDMDEVQLIPDLAPIEA